MKNSSTNSLCMLKFRSDCWGNSQFCSLCLCSCTTCNSFGSFEYNFQVRGHCILRGICFLWDNCGCASSSIKFEFGCCFHLRNNCKLISRCSAVLAHFILKERLHIFGVLGCALCVVGSTTIVLHAPHERDIHSVKEVWELATEPGNFYPWLLGFNILNHWMDSRHLCMINYADIDFFYSSTGFLIYSCVVVVVVCVLIFYFVPRYGQSHLIVYVGICSLTGSITVSIISSMLIIYLPS